MQICIDDIRKYYAFMHKHIVYIYIYDGKQRWLTTLNSLVDKDGNTISKHKQREFKKTLIIDDTFLNYNEIIFIDDKIFDPNQIIIFKGELYFINNKTSAHYSELEDYSKNKICRSSDDLIKYMKKQDIDWIIQYR